MLGFLKAQNVLHAVQPCRLLDDELRRGQRSVRIAIAIARLHGQLERFAEQAEHDRVFARVVARANGVVADLVLGASSLKR